MLDCITKEPHRSRTTMMPSDKLYLVWWIVSIWQSSLTPTKKTPKIVDYSLTFIPQGLINNELKQHGLVYWHICVGLGGFNNVPRCCAAMTFWNSLLSNGDIYRVYNYMNSM